MNITRLIALALCAVSFPAYAQQAKPTDYVNPFIGSSKYGTTNPGALCPNGMMSVSPFNVMGFYPDCPGDPSYTLTTPRFDRIEITLDPKYCGGRISHADFVSGS